MLFWSLADDLTVVNITLIAICIYLAYDLTRIAGGAPKAWYLVVAALLLLLVRRAAELYIDVQTSISLLGEEAAVISFFVALLFFLGLLMLNRNFKKRIRVSQESLS